MTPAVRVMLSNNRIRNFIPKYEVSNIYSDTITLLAIVLFTVPAIIVGIVCAGVYRYPIKLPLALLMALAYLVSHTLMYVSKRRNYYVFLVDEANQMSIPEHRVRRKRLLLTCFMRYILPVLAMIASAVLANYLMHL